jgi:hypothetical protein
VAAVLLFLARRQLDSRFLRGLARFALVIVSVLFIASAGVFGWSLYERVAEPAAVIVADATGLSPEPGIAPANAPKLPAGAEVRVVASRDDWRLVRAESQRAQGWVPADSIAIVG